MALSESEELELLELEKSQAMAAAPDPDIPVPGHASEVNPGVGGQKDPQDTSIGGRVRKAASYLEGVPAVASEIVGTIPGAVLGGGNALTRKLMGRGGPGLVEGAVEGARAASYEPRTAQGGEAAGEIRHAIEGLGPTGGMLTGGLGADMRLAAKSLSASEPVAQAAGKVVGSAARAVSESPAADLVRRGAEKVGAAGTKVREFASDFTGRDVGPAKVDAAKAARGAVERGMAKTSKGAQQDALRVEAISGIQSKLDAEVEAIRTSPADLKTQGGSIRQAFQSAMQSGREAREEMATATYGEAKAAAAAKEAGGQRVDTKAIETALEDMLIEASGITDLETELKGMLTAIRGRPKAMSEQAEAFKKSAFWNPEPEPKEFKGESLLSAIQRIGGIAKGQMRTLSGETRVGKGMKGLRPNLFKNDGWELGELVTRLRDEEGFLIAGDSVDDGVANLNAMIVEELGGKKIYNAADTDRFTAYEFDARMRADAEAAAGVVPEGKGKTFEQLLIVNRKLKDIANSADFEGYGSIVRDRARTTSKALDAALTDFSPEYGAANRIYEEMSKPLETLGTRFGKILNDTEGGLLGKAYQKVADEKLPDRVFADSGTIERLVDALAGGKKGVASDAARDYAQKTVDAMAEAWIREKILEGGPTKALEALSKPDMRAKLTSLPNVRDALVKQFGDASGMESAAKGMVKNMKMLTDRGAERTALAANYRKQVNQADYLLGLKSDASKKEAITILRGVLNDAHNKEWIADGPWERAKALIDQADSLDEKAALARRLAAKIGVSAAVIGGGAEAVSYLK